MLTIVAGLFMIGFLVVIHEAGHFVAAKIFGIGAPVFSIGMGPRIAGFEWKGTDYRLSALPIGGYVQMAGADPFGEEDTGAWVDPEEDFMRKPVWQRLIVMAAGPAVNLALPFGLFTILLMMGRPDTAPTVGVVFPDSPAAVAGLQVGDVVTAIDGEPVDIWVDVENALMAHADEAVTVTVLRDGAPATVTLPAGAVAVDDDRLDAYALGAQPFYLSTRIGVDASDSPAGRAGLVAGDRITQVDGAEVERWGDLLAALDDGDAHAITWVRTTLDDDGQVADETTHEGTLDRSGGSWAGVGAPFETPWGFAPVMLFAQRVEEGAPAARAGVQPGDRFLDVDGAPVLTFYHFIDLVEDTRADDGSARALTLTVLRDGARETMQMTPEIRVVSGEAYSRPIIGVSSFSRIGVSVGTERKYYGPIEAAQRGVRESLAVFEMTLAGLGNLLTFRSDPRESLGGPVAIFVAAGTVAEMGFFPYATVVGMLSVSIGLINLLPVPVLDGGQILFYAVEGLRGRPLSLELREQLQMVGVAGLAILMFLVTVNDITRSLGF